MTLVYSDPLDLVWLHAADRVGMKVVRSDDVYASWDGKGTLTLSTTTHFDPDDSLAQMILHEMCHALIEGDSARSEPDWGLDNISDEDVVREYACHRLQAALTDPHGLRRFFCVTTEFRPYYESLPEDPLGEGGEGHDPAIAPARLGFERSQARPWSDVLQDALQATASIARATHNFVPTDSLWGTFEPPPSDG